LLVRTTMHCSKLQRTATSTATHCNIVLPKAFIKMQQDRVCRFAPQCIATHCHALQLRLQHTLQHCSSESIYQHAARSRELIRPPSRILSASYGCQDCNALQLAATHTHCNTHDHFNRVSWTFNYSITSTITVLQCVPLCCSVLR